MQKERLYIYDTTLRDVQPNALNHGIHASSNLFKRNQIKGLSTKVIEKSRKFCTTAPNLRRIANSKGIKITTKQC